MYGHHRHYRPLFGHTKEVTAPGEVTPIRWTMYRAVTPGSALGRWNGVRAAHGIADQVIGVVAIDVIHFDAEFRVNPAKISQLPEGAAYSGLAYPEIFADEVQAWESPIIVSSLEVQVEA
ncbi:hypothetical protein CE91St41_35790 [Oscillospiraceae bacterium]|nr:hypothetical protein CE91St40_35780 [Oscillospiraceae bacterium]BDF76690.1 hypothetical protein CE91St41_35790 [Oscillospiraceae bacterium]